jgi:Family of unknown function (DUF6194)
VRSGIEPAEIVADLLGLDPHLRVEPYYSEQAVFYNPGGEAPLGVIFAAVKDHDGPNDRASRLSRPGVFRFAFALAPGEYAARFGDPPPRPARGQVVRIASDPSALGELGPHPVYAWMRWVQILSPTRGQFVALQPLLEESLGLVRSRWERRQAAA